MKNLSYAPNSNRERVTMNRLLVLLSIIFFATTSVAMASDHPENCWVKQSPRDGVPAPGFGWEGSGNYDPVNRKWIHFGGHDGWPQGFHLFTFDLKTGI